MEVPEGDPSSMKDVYSEGNSGVKTNDASRGTKVKISK